MRRINCILPNPIQYNTLILLTSSGPDRVSVIDDCIGFLLIFLFLMASERYRRSESGIGYERRVIVVEREWSGLTGMSELSTPLYTVPFHVIDSPFCLLNDTLFLLLFQYQFLLSRIMLWMIDNLRLQNLIPSFQIILRQYYTS